MFSRISAAFIYVLTAFTILAAATCSPTTVTVTPPASTATQPASQCNTGPIQCCNSMQSATSTDASKLLGLLGIVLTDLNVLVGLTCTPITVVGTGSVGCSATPVCCQNNSFNGLIAIGCVPVNLSLRK